MDVLTEMDSLIPSLFRDCRVLTGAVGYLSYDKLSMEQLPESNPMNWDCQKRLI